jgi:hypothetical protein
MGLEACDWVSLITVVFGVLLTLSEAIGWSKHTEASSVSEILYRVLKGVLGIVQGGQGGGLSGAADAALGEAITPHDRGMDPQGEEERRPPPPPHSNSVQARSTSDTAETVDTLTAFPFFSNASSSSVSRTV